LQDEGVESLHGSLSLFFRRSIISASAYIPLCLTNRDWNGILVLKGEFLFLTSSFSRFVAGHLASTPPDVAPLSQRGKNARSAIVMSTPRLLLPFTHGIDNSAITAALTLAQQRGATLVLVSLLRLPTPPDTRSVRAEAIAQSNDFLEFVRHKAARTGVPVEYMELYTHDIVRSIRLLSQELDCLGILLFVRNGAGVLLDTTEIKRLLEQTDLFFFLGHLPSKLGIFSHLRRFFQPFRL
jgi:hypothetical protein